MATKAVRYYSVEEGSTENMHYRITVKDHLGKVVDEFLRPTMAEALSAFEHAGYRRVAGAA
jgi:ferredoxin-NADP reductase